MGCFSIPGLSESPVVPTQIENAPIRFRSLNLLARIIQAWIS